MNAPERIRNIALLAFLAHAPWHGAYSFGRRDPIGWIFGKLTWLGLVNILWIFLLLVVLVPLLVRSLKVRSLRWIELTPLVLPLIVLLSVRVVDGTSAVAIENTFLLSILLILLHRSDTVPQLPWVERWGFLVLGTSLLFAVLLPLAIPLDVVEVYFKIGEVVRYRGWLGEGTPMVLTAAIAATVGLERLFVSLRSRKWIWAGGFLGMIAFSLGSIFANLHRSSLAIAAFGMCAVLYQGLPASFRVRFYTILAFVLAVILLFVNSPAFDRTVRPFTEDTIILSHEFEYKGQSFVPLGETGIWRKIPRGFDYGLSGRLSLLMSSVEARKEANPMADVFGGGTGFGVRFVRSMVPRIVNEPQSEYLRYWMDFGWVGLLALVSVMALALWKAGPTLARVLVLLLAVYMMTENILVYPAFGYGPILLLAFAERRKAISPLARATQGRPQENQPQDSALVDGHPGLVSKPEYGGRDDRAQSDRAEGI